jgi:pimeloyl-ACP methyl ester carboxylesterase
MHRMNIIPHRHWLVMAWLILSMAQMLPPEARAQSLRPSTFSELQKQLSGQEASVNRFRQRGPFEVAVAKDRALRLSAKERILADVYLASPAEKAPLVIFLHGHDCSKEAHAKQAAHVASWGMHAVSLQLSKTGPWDVNARTLARIDVNRIILSGHSFGGHAVALAMAQGAAVAGGILLDPAYFGRATPEFLYKIRQPVMVLGADELQHPVRRREYFYDYIQGDVAEVSIRDASHEDAQFPSETSLQNAGVDPDTVEERQISFVSGIVATAFSLSTTRSLDYAWASLREMVDSGKMFHPKKK